MKSAYNGGNSAQGHSYNDIGALTGWSYTKVNRCLTEGRRSFLERYADIESGAECERWLPTISAMVDGEASAEQLVELRPHLRNCPGCRATLRALQDSSAPLSAIMPIPLAAAATDGAEHVASLFTRAYEVLASGLHDRAVTSFTKVQALVETTAVGKTAAIAGAAAAMAGGGYATVERSAVERPVVRTPAATHGPRASSRPLKDSAARPVSAPSGGSSTTVGATRSSARREFGPLRARRTANRAPEFGATQEQLRAAASGATASSVGSSTSAPRAPEFAPQPRAAKSPEFGP